MSSKYRFAKTPFIANVAPTVCVPLVGKTPPEKTALTKLAMSVSLLGSGVTVYKAFCAVALTVNVTREHSLPGCRRPAVDSASSDNQRRRDRYTDILTM